MKDSMKLLNSFIAWWNPPVKPKRKKRKYTKRKK
tara:strand:- start:248 stop:349 length:102 start_codon:yes stop_codon:yes gene_type:complete